jgi:hypothetical protein
LSSAFSPKRGPSNQRMGQLTHRPVGAVEAALWEPRVTVRYPFALENKPGLPLTLLLS